VNLDVVAKWPGYPPCDIIWDARTDKLPFDDDSVDEVVAGYLLLHVASHHHDRLLDDIYRVMKPGARLEFGEVDMRLAFERWLSDPDDVSANEMIWGECGNRENPEYAKFEEFDTHRAGYDFQKLERKLTEHGFRNVRRFKQHAPEVWYEMSVECVK
jgi:ubiquinone/menaquinone biosynthesis C-methylase UbiE